MIIATGWWETFVTSRSCACAGGGGPGGGPPRPAPITILIARVGTLIDPLRVRVRPCGGRRLVREYSIGADEPRRRAGCSCEEDRVPVLRHWSQSPSSVRSASDALLQSLELAVAAEEVGADGAYYRVHHFARQLSCRSRCWPPSALGRRGSRSAPRSSTCATRIRSTWRRTLGPQTSWPVAGCSGISRGSPEQVIDGWRYFGFQPVEGETDAEMARRHAEVFIELLKGEGSPSRIRGRCSRTRRACCASSPIRRDCASGFGGARRHRRLRRGRPPWA